jgi:hypothetical protein
MRIKIETEKPLPLLKTWINVATGLFVFSTTIDDLRKRLVSEFSLPPEIILELNGFVLRGKDATNAVLEKDELVM